MDNAADAPLFRIDGQVPIGDNDGHFHLSLSPSVCLFLSLTLSVYPPLSLHLWADGGPNGLWSTLIRLNNQ